MNNPELPLDPNLQTSNLLITFLKYASIVMQDTKGKQTFICSYLILDFFIFSLHLFFLPVKVILVFLQMSID